MAGAHEPILARPTSTREHVQKWLRRRPPFFFAMASAIVISLALRLAGFLWQWNRATRDAKDTESALRQAQDSLWQANFDRARALRTSRQMGQRVEALKAIRAAAAIRATPELREEAIGALALTDLEDVGAWQPLPANVGKWSVDSRPGLLALSRSDGTVEMRGFRDGQLRGVLTNGQPLMETRFNETGDVLLAYDDERFRVWDLRTTNLLFDAQPRVGHRVGISRDGWWLAYPAAPSSVIWQTKLESPPRAGHASLAVSEACGVRQYVVFHALGLSGFAASDGKLLWEYVRPNTRTASSYTPLVRGDLICSPNGYGGGIALIKLSRENVGFAVTELYNAKEDCDPFQDSTALVGDLLYTSRTLGLATCLELQTGKIIWDARSTAGAGRVALTCADGHLYLRHANGTMTLAAATPRGYTEMGSFKIPDHEPSIGVTFPVIAGGRLLIRDNDRLHCYDVSTNTVATPRHDPRHVTIALSAKELSLEAFTSRPPRAGTDRAPDAVFVPTPNDVVARMLELAGVKKESVVVDLGSGDGRFVIAAAKRYGCQAIGYEIDKRLVEISREAVAKEKLESLARIEHEDIFTRDLSGADVVTVFLYPRLMERLIPQLNKLKPGSRIVSHQFEMPGLKPDQVIVMDSKETGDKHRILLWTAPLQKE